VQGKYKNESDLKNIIVPKPPSIMRSKNSATKLMRKAVTFKNIVDGQYFDEENGTQLDNTDDFVNVLKAPQKKKWQVPKVSILDVPVATRKTSLVAPSQRIFRNMQQPIFSGP